MTSQLYFIIIIVYVKKETKKIEMKSSQTISFIRDKRFKNKKGWNYFLSSSFIFFLFFSIQQIVRERSLDQPKMASLVDISSDPMLDNDMTTEWTTETQFPFSNTTLNWPNVDLSYRHNISFYPQCPSAGPNNVGRYISMILYTIVCIIGLFGNSLVI